MVEGNHHRREDVDVLLHLADPLEKLVRLPENPTEIFFIDLRAPISDRVDPEDAIPLRQPFHNMFLAQWIAVPIVRKTDDLFSLKHDNPL
jgi:hypothetical protein